MKLFDFSEDIPVLIEFNKEGNLFWLPEYSPVANFWMSSRLYAGHPPNIQAPHRDYQTIVINDIVYYREIRFFFWWGEPEENNVVRFRWFSSDEKISDYLIQIYAKDNLIQ
jgi:hypothetical protein